VTVTTELVSVGTCLSAYSRPKENRSGRAFGRATCSPEIETLTFDGALSASQRKGMPENFALGSGPRDRNAKGSPDAFGGELSVAINLTIRLNRRDSSKRRAAVAGVTARRSEFRLFSGHRKESCPLFSYSRMSLTGWWGSTPVRRMSSPWCLTVKRRWSMPRQWRIVAFRSWMCTGFSTML